MNNRKRELMNPQSGVFQGIVLQTKLILRLLGDRRVNFFLKLLPIAAIVYVVSPVDLVPGLALPVIGALDDAAVLWLGTSLFMALCPDDVVDEHKQALEKVVHGVWRDAENKPSSEIIEVKPTEPDESDKAQ